MGLFVKKTTPISTVQYVTIGAQKTKLVVGLGNIGKKYELTRHNIGFLCVEDIVKREEGNWKEKKEFSSFVSEIKIGDKRVIFIKPTTLMNLSGNAVQAVKNFYKIDNKDILVIHDELDINFGSIRLRAGGSSAGHNGIKSVTEHIGEDYSRLRIGIKNKHTSKQDSADFVLKPFSSEEQGNLKTMQTEVASLITEFVFSDQLLPDTRKFI